MGIRLKSAFRSLNDDYYKIEIHDSAYSAPAIDVSVGGDGFTLTHDGETDAVYSTIVGSSVALTIYNDSSAVDSFRTGLLNAQDKQFSMRIERAKKPALQFKDRVESDGGTFEAYSCVESAINALGGTEEPDPAEYEVFWLGYITQDLIEEADESKPRAIKITAADGISLLSTFDYEFGLAQSFSKDMRQIVCDILDDSGIADLFESTETMLTTVVNWYADEHTYSASSDPMTLTKFDLKAFTTWSSGASRQYTNALQVIREMAVIMGARFYFSNGSFRFEQIGERDNTTIREFYYLNDNSANGNADIILDTTVDQQSTHRMGGTFRYLPAVKRVNLRQQKLAAFNLIGGQVQFPADEIDVGIVPSANNGRVLLQMRSVFQTIINTPLVGTATPVFAVTIRLEPSDGTADQYWTNQLVSGFVSFGVGSWGTTLGTYKCAANTVGRQTSSTTHSVHQLATGPLPKDGELYIDITILGFYDAQGSSTSFFTGGNSFNWNVYLNSARFENDNDPADIVETIFTSTNTSPNIGSNIAVDMTTTRLGDGPGAAGSLYAYTGSVWTQSTGWRIGDDGTFIDVAELATKEVLALQNNVVRRFEGTIINGGIFLNRFYFDIGYWLPMRSTFVANDDELQIEAFLVKRTVTNIDTTAVGVGSGTGGGGGATPIAHYSGSYTNSGSGSIAGMTIDSGNNSIGPFAKTSTGGEVEGTMNVTGATTMQSTLSVSGTSSLAQTNVREFTTTDRVNVTINDITATPGGSQTLSFRNNFNFITYSGGNGTHTINLPSSEDGVILRFKTDSTIGANKKVNLQPQSGEQIDDETSYDLDRAYDGITLLGKNSNWFVIQKKEK